MESCTSLLRPKFEQQWVEKRNKVREKDKQTDRHRQRARDRHTDRQIETRREGQIQGERDKQTERHIFDRLTKTNIYANTKHTRGYKSELETSPRHSNPGWPLDPFFPVVFLRAPLLKQL